MILNIHMLSSSIVNLITHLVEKFDFWMAEMELEELYQNVIDGHQEPVKTGTQAALNAGVPAEVILNSALIPGMDEVGRRFEAGEFFVPEMMIAARAMKAGLTILKPHLRKSGVEAVSKISIGTVAGDLHDIGKNLVIVMLEGGGFEVEDLGVDVLPEGYVKAAQGGCQVVAMSALLTTTMDKMGESIEALDEAGVRQQVKVIVGGAPVTQAFADQIGADSYAIDAASAVRKVRGILA